MVVSRTGDEASAIHREVVNGSWVIVALLLCSGLEHPKTTLLRAACADAGAASLACGFSPHAGSISPLLA
jgi:hypothetical protein